MQYKAIKLVKRPGLQITPDIFETVTLETPALDDGQILVKQTHMSLDPAMKGWMSPDKESYIPPVELETSCVRAALGKSWNRGTTIIRSVRPLGD